MNLKRLVIPLTAVALLASDVVAQVVRRYQTVATVAELYTANVADDDLYQTRGYSTEGLGANLYRYDASSSAAVDHGFVLDGKGGNGTGTGTGRFIAVDQRRVDVTQFGAIPDDANDDSVAIGRALTALTDNGTLLFPKGNYKTITNITMPPGTTGCHILGYGATLQADTGVVLLLVLSDDTVVEGLHCNGNGIANYAIYIADGVSGCKVRYVRAGNVVGTTAVAIGIEGDGADNTVIEFCTIYDVIGSSVGRGIRVSGNTSPATPVRGIKIINNTITNVEPVADGDGICVQDWTAVVDVLIHGNTITLCDKRGIKIQSPGVIISQNHIVIPGTTAYGAIDVQTSGCQILGNRIYGAADTIISMGSTLGATGNICSNNRIEIPSGHGASSVDAIVTEGSAVADVQITDNIVTAGSAIRSFVSFEGEGTSATVSGNTFSGPVSGGSAAIYTGYNSPASSTDNVKISNNTFRGVTGEYLLTDFGQSSTGIRWEDNVTDGAEAGFTASTTIGVLYFGTVTGTPESVIRAGVGSQALRTNGGAGTTYYVKESGVGTTGWVAK